MGDLSGGFQNWCFKIERVQYRLCHLLIYNFNAFSLILS